jgi:hypothetical protein
VVAFMLIQFVIGFLNHRGYKKTQTPTKMALPHIWLGRFIIIFGVMNAFL